MSQIGAALGATRNAVIGKVARLGLEVSRTATSPSGVKPVAKPARIIMTQPKPLPVAAEPLPFELPPLPRPSRKTSEMHSRSPGWTGSYTGVFAVLALGKCKCKWPIGDVRDTAFRFCLAETPSGEHSYCPHHARVASAGYASQRTGQSFDARINRVGAK